MAAATGFVMPVVLGILLIAALLAAQASTDLGTHTMLATHRLMHLRAFAAAERGLNDTITQLRAGANPQTGEASGSLPGESVMIALTAPEQTVLPAGFSANRVVEECRQIHSTGRSARGAQVTLRQGLCQRRPHP